MKHLSCCEALENLAAGNQYLFHGSPNANIETFVPQTPQSRADSKGTPIEYDDKVVFATMHLDVAIFAAVVFHLGRSGWYTHDESIPISFTFNADAAVVEKARTAVGYVYVLPQNQFQHSKNTLHEYVSNTEVSPQYRVEVDASDLLPALETLQPDPDPSH